MTTTLYLRHYDFDVVHGMVHLIQTKIEIDQNKFVWVKNVSIINKLMNADKGDWHYIIIVINVSN